MEDQQKPLSSLEDKVSVIVEELSSENNVKIVQLSFLRKFWWLFVILAVILIGGLILEKPLSKLLGSQKEQDKKQVIEQVDDTKQNKILIDPDNPPKFIQADFVELDKIFSISKFRSGFGHDFSYLSGETCRSMKHYFASIDPAQSNYKYEGLSVNQFPTPTVEKDVKIFSPVDGNFRIVSFDNVSYNNEVQVYPDSYPGVTIRLMHVQKIPNVKEGKVKAGDPIGLVLANQSFDLAIEVDLTSGGKKKIGYMSYFAAMPDNIFAKYQARGVKNREDLIVTKEYRNAHQFTCHGVEVFDKNYPLVDGRDAHVVDLTGFKEMEASMNTKYPNPNVVKTKDTNN